MQHTFFSAARISVPTLALATLFAPPSGLSAANPRLVGAPGMPVVVNEPLATVVSAGGKQFPVQVVTVVDAPTVLATGRGGRVDPGWVWLAGVPGPLAWSVSTSEVPPPSSFDVRWCEPMTRAEFDKAVIAGADGKPLGAGERGPAVWLDAVTPGWEALSRAALAVVGEFNPEQQTAVAAALRTPLATPGDHWRAALLLRAMNPSSSAPAAFEPAALNTLARQQGDLWAGAIGRLARSDAAVALQVARRLVQVGYLPTTDRSGGWGVLWCDADPRLLDTLITAPPSAAVTAAKSFVAGQPQALAWVLDDAGLRDAFTGGPRSTLGLVSLGEQRAVATAAFGSGQPGDPVPMRPLIGQLLGGAGSQEQGAGAAVASVNAGPASITLSIAGAPVAASPPGVLIGPFFADWTLRSFREQQPRRTGGVAGSLLPSAGAGGVSGGAGTTASGWTLYLECRGESGRDVDGERLRVWAGPSGAPTVAIELAPDGSVTVRDLEPRAASAASVPVIIGRIPGGWCASVNLPAAVADSSGLMRIAVEHIGVSGMRSCWPRPMLPWQTEPGRTAINVAAWNRELKP